MGLDAVYEWGRWAHLVLSIVAFVWLVVRSAARWHVYPYTVQLFLLTLSFYVFAAGYGTAEVLYDDSPPGPRIFVYLLGVIALLVTLAITQKMRVVLAGRSDVGGGPRG